jgi:hypothetical protein
MKKLRFAMFALLALLFGGAALAASAGSDPPSIPWRVFSGAGAPASSAHFKLQGSLGQTAIGFAGGSTHTISSGFWYRGGGLLIYDNDFETPPGPEWACFSGRDTTPAGARQYLGQLGNQTACLDLKGLAPHTQVMVSFDVYLIRSWNGNRTGGGGLLDPDPDPEADPVIGPDRWQVTADGLLRLDTSFANKPTHDQSYPSAFGLGSFPPTTQANEVNTLGYLFNSAPMDSVYRVTLSFPHSANSLLLNFTGSGLQALDNESWGLDNIQVKFTTFKYMTSVYLPLVIR